MADHSTKATPSNSSKSQERDDWIAAHVLLPIENNFGKYYTADQVRFFCSKLSGWSDADLLQTVQYIIDECQYFPKMADFKRLRPKRSEPDQTPLNETPRQTFDRLKGPTDGPHRILWDRVVVELHKRKGAKRFRQCYQNVLDNPEFKRTAPELLTQSVMQAREGCR